jgi:hypothetical protein
MRVPVRRLIVGLAVAGLVSGSAGCSTGDDGGTESPGTTVTASASASATESGGTPVLIPDRVTVNQPAFIDTSRSPDSLPVWPGPNPSEFLKPSPPTGETGELTGAPANAVFVASQTNSEMLWNVDGVVQWLVVRAVP